MIKWKFLIDECVSIAAAAGPTRPDNRACCVAGPVAQNSLPLGVRSAPTLSIFKNMLKTNIFSRSYFTD